MINKYGLKLITFDATGTLLQFRKPPAQIYAEIASRHGIHTNEEELKKSFKNQWTLLNQNEPHFGKCWKTWWTQFVVGTFVGSGVGEKFKPQLHTIALELIDHFRTVECWQLRPGAKELLEDIKNSKLRIGIISNFDPRLRGILKELSISEFFDLIILSHEVKVSKPSQEIFRKALMSFSKIELKNDVIEGNKCLHIGDNYELDFLGAKASGWNSVLISNDSSNDDLLDKNCKFNSLIDFKKYFFQTLR